MTTNITDKVIIMTGASSGIGEATARLLAANGAKVVLAARRTDRLETLTQDIRAAGGTADYMAVDVADANAMLDLATYALGLHGRIDVMFNNAGIMPLSPMNALKTSEWNSMIDINIKGVLNGIAAVLPVMEKQKSGQIINTASIGAHLVMPTGAVYCATKYAVWAISEGLRQESKDIRVTVISPGVTATELGHDISDSGTKEVLGELRKSALTPDAIAHAVLYAVGQPDGVDINEIIVRPTSSAF